MSTSASNGNASAGALVSHASTSLGASSSSPFTVGHLITIKLMQENYLLWRAQVVPLLRSYCLMGVLNPGFATWNQQDSAILSAIISSMTEGVIGQVLFMTTSREVWSTLESMFASQSRARSMQIRVQLSHAKKGNASASVYFNRVKTLADTLSAIGQPLKPGEFICYLLAGLDGEYEGFVSTVTCRDTVMPIHD